MTKKTKVDEPIKALKFTITDKQLQPGVFAFTEICPKKKEVVLYLADKYSFHSDEYECETCGSHGSIEVFVECNLCEELHDFEIRGW